MEELIPVLQAAVGPVILVSAVGLLLLTLNNRIATTVTRIRTLAAAKNTSTSNGEKTKLETEIGILWQRAHAIRHSIEFAAISALSATLLILILFVAKIMNIEAAFLVVFLFCGALVALAFSLGFLIWDVRKSLEALKYEVEQ